MVGPSNLFMPLGFSKFLLQTIHYEAALRGHCNQAPIATIPFILASLRKCPRVSNLLTPLHFICECCTSAVLIWNGMTLALLISFHPIHMDGRGYSSMLTLNLKLVRLLWKLFMIEEFGKYSYIYIIMSGTVSIFLYTWVFVVDNRAEAVRLMRN